MCGIAGWNFTEKPSALFCLALAATMETRGEDSYGYFDGANIHKGKGAITQKLSASALVSLSGFLHTRLATKGAVTEKNSHPFAIGDLIGAHNGMVYNHEELNKTYKRKCAVDSMHIFEHIAANLPLSDVEGYGAIEYYQDGKYLLGQCNHGDLEIALTPLGVVWASTKDAIVSACKQGEIAITHFFDVESGKVYRADTDNLYETDKTFQLAYNPIWNKKDWRTSGIGQASTFYSPLMAWERGDQQEISFGASETVPDDTPDDTPKTEWAECEWCGEWVSNLVSCDDSKVCAECAEREIEHLDESEFLDHGELGKCEWCGHNKHLLDVYSAMICYDCKQILV